MKIILSRKGFDKGAGGCPSPYIVDEGILYSIPIPGEGNYFSYKDLKFNDKLSCYDLMEQLKIKCRDSNAHTDPDIRYNLYYSPDSKWKPMFGQQGLPQKHLAKQGVGKGDLFLFYGLFQEVKQIDGIYCFIPHTTRQIIWGYMQVGAEPKLVTENPENLYHPHYYGYKNYNEKSKNTVYSASENLSFAKSLPGYGVFNYHPSLVLSKEVGDKANIYNVCKFPLHFYEHRMTGNHAEWRWKKEDENCIVTIANRGQEFVIHDDEQAIDWAKNLIMNNA